MKEPGSVLKKYNLKLKFKPSADIPQMSQRSLSKSSGRKRKASPAKVASGTRVPYSKVLPLFRNKLDPSELARKQQILKVMNIY